MVPNPAVLRQAPLSAGRVHEIADVGVDSAAPVVTPTAFSGSLGAAALPVEVKAHWVCHPRGEKSCHFPFKLVTASAATASRAAARGAAAAVSAPAASAGACTIPLTILETRRGGRRGVLLRQIAPLLLCPPKSQWRILHQGSAGIVPQHSIAELHDELAPVRLRAANPRRVVVMN